jgi:hypothetical protein
MEQQITVEKRRFFLDKEPRKNIKWSNKYVVMIVLD